MKLWKKAVMGYLGGMDYVGLELLWRGWSHGSMFVVGGVCFLLLEALSRKKIHFVWKVILGAWMIIGIELLSGMILNQYMGLHIWSYRGIPWNFMGQICPLYFLLWHPTAAAGLLLCHGLRWILGISHEKRGLKHILEASLRYCPIYSK